MERVLSIAGSDPSGGAGIQADLKTFHAFGVYGMAVITALTAQNTRGVTAIHDPPPEFVAAELAAVFDDIRVDAVKTGMLKTPAVIEAVAAALAAQAAVPLVVDPVMVSTSGHRLIEDSAIDSMRRVLLPLAAVVTPNREEAQVLSGLPVGSLEAAREAARVIAGTGARAVLVKGVRDGDDFVDVLLAGAEYREYRHAVLAVGPTHGTGCTLSAALAAALALGASLPRAVEVATDFVWRAIRESDAVGRGAVPLNHFVRPGEVRR